MAYSKEGVLKDGSRVKLRPLVKEDRDMLLKFFQGLDAKELSFLRSNVQDPAVVDHWVNHIDYHRVFPLVAEADGRIVGDITLHMRKVGWKRHLGNVRVVVSPDYQGKGLGTLLINEIVELAGEFGLEKLLAEIHFQAIGAFNAFKKAGFSVKAVFEDLVKDPAGKSSDLVVMICDIQARDRG
jgi:RimJ/RimL family protein N-acetyltransferase